MKSDFKANRLAALACLMSSAFLVTSCGGGDEGQIAGAAAPVAAPAPAPAPPTAGTATLAWTAPTGAAVTGYRVYYGTASRVYDQALGSGVFVATSAYTVSGLSSGRTYYFAVTAVDAAGAESAFSNEASKLTP